MKKAPPGKPAGYRFPRDAIVKIRFNVGRMEEGGPPCGLRIFIIAKLTD
jgi:hypothetical protein